MLDCFFRPFSVAVVGASRNPNKIGHKIVKNLIEYGFRGEIYPVNPKAEEILGLKAYPSVLDIPGRVDLAVIAVPAHIVPEIMEDVGRKGVPCAAIISSGFGEVGRKDLEAEVVERARKYGVRVLGPNIFGVLYTPTRLNATFGPKDVKEGGIALLSQSGALGIALMGWTVVKDIGLSAVVSLGNKADVEEADLLPFFASDPATKVVLMYMEGLRDGRRFMEAVRKFPKPVVVIKAGKTERGERAVSSHTGSLAGSDLVYEGAFKQMGVIRAYTLEEAFVMARALEHMEPPQGPVVVITNGGGIGVLATDALEEREIPLYQGDDLVRFRSAMPEFGSWRNPVDITGMAGVEEYRRALRIALDNKNIGGIILLYCETAVCDPERLAEVIVSEYNREKPLVVGMVGGKKTERAIAYLNRHGIPAYDTAEKAVTAYHALVLWGRYRKKRIVYKDH